MKNLIILLLFVPLISYGQTTTITKSGNTTYINTPEGTATANKIGNTTYINNPDGTTTTVNEIGNTKYINNPSGTSNANEMIPKRKGGIKSNVDVYEASKNAYSNQNISGDVSDDAYDKLGDAAGQLMAIALIRKAEKKFFKYENEYKENPSLETAFEIEKNGRRAIYLTENTAKLINSASNDKNYKSTFNGATKIKDKWGPISEEHKLIVQEHKTFKKYSKYLKKKKKKKKKKSILVQFAEKKMMKYFIH